jgi:16S rRNA (adenine1518-N6/adenine1519-N6)-dimethyltransferase
LKRPLGQHFLFDPGILKRIVESSGITSADRVVEIGAGIGTLTNLLAERAQKVLAIEIDRKLVARLKTSLSEQSNVEIKTADALKYPFETIEGSYRVVANIPYYITTPLIFRLLTFRKQILSMTLLLQKEIARRIVASPGGSDYGVLSITVQLYTEPEIKFSIPRGAFSPPPDVDSAVVHFKVFPQLRYSVKDERFFIKVVKTAFSQRRKMVSNSLKSFAGIKEALQNAGIDPKVRPEKLGIADFLRLAEALRNNESLSH